jgi:O-antigen ligase
MTGFARAGWLLAAALFATALSSLLHVDHVGVVAEILLVLIAIVAAVRPDIGMMIVVAATPVAWYLASQFWSWTVAWPEAVVCAVLTGVSLNAVAARDRGRRLPLGVSAPAVLFGALVVASLIASLGVKALRLGPGFTDALVVQLTRTYFSDLRSFPGLHAGMLLLEGVLLFAAAARIAAGRAGDDRFLRRMAAAAAASATLAAALNVARLLQKAWRGESFLASLIELSVKERWNVHYSDFNAAGSYFVMALLLAAALAVAARGGRRLSWMSSAAVIAIGLWLTSSRVAVLAGGLATGIVLLIGEISRGRARAMRAIAVAAAGLLLLVVAAIALPQRGNQTSSLLAADVRVGLLQTGARMIASRPVFGIGLGEFSQRSAEFSSPELIAKFPAVGLHENAHNNFVQVAAELGVAAGVLFAWLIGAALVAIARRAVTTMDTDPRDPRDPRPDDPRFPRVPRPDDPRVPRVPRPNDPSDPRVPRPSDPRVPRLLTLAALVAFALTCLGGHPLLVKEPGYVFWTLLGAAAGSAASLQPARSRLWWLVPVGLIAVALTLPWRLSATTQDADLEHVGIGVSSAWQTSPDDIRYREAQGHASLFILAGDANRFSVYPLADQSLRLEMKLGGRVADVVTLAPRRWNTLTIPARSEISRARYARLDLQLVDADQTAIWITKVQPIQ